MYAYAYMVECIFVLFIRYKLQFSEEKKLDIILLVKQENCSPIINNYDTYNMNLVEPLLFMF